MIRRCRSPETDESGSGSVLTLITVALTLMAFVVVIVVGSYLVVDHRATAAADHAALSGAQSFGANGDRGQACRVAQRSAALNGARVVQCQVVGDSVDYAVGVVVAVEVGVLWPGLPTEVRAGASAGRLTG